MTIDTAIVEAIHAVQLARRGAEAERQYLGMSSLGHPCKRALWYEHRHAYDADHSPRMLRLFNTGHREEVRVIAELREAGFEVLGINPTTTDQWEVSDFGRHLQGHFDALILIDGLWYLLEIKTSNTSEFKQTRRKGVLAAKPMHYAQMQSYLGYAQRDWGTFNLDGPPTDEAIYLMVCKETDDILVEVIEFEPSIFETLRDRALGVIQATEPPAKLREAHGYPCQLCDYGPICHDAESPRVDCRTCMHVTPAATGWACERYGSAVPDEFLTKGCGEHLFISPLLENRFGFVSSYDSSELSEPVLWVEYKDGEGVVHVNVAESSSKRGLSSVELAAIQGKG